MDLSNQEFYVLLKKVNQNLVLSDFTLEKMNYFKEKLIFLLKRFLENSNPSDIILLPLIFFVAKRSFYKLKKPTLMMLRQMSNNNQNNSNSNLVNENFSKLNNSGNNLGNERNFQTLKYKDENEKKNYTRNGELLLESLNISFNFLDVILHEDISISALNYIFRFLEEPLYFQNEDKLHLVFLI